MDARIREGGTLEDRESYAAFNKTTGQWERVSTLNVVKEGLFPNLSGGRYDYLRYVNAMSDMTNIATATFGSYPYGGLEDYIPGPSNLKAAPIGLGWLLATEVMSDPRALYCPSGAEVRWSLVAGGPGCTNGKTSAIDPVDQYDYCVRTGTSINSRAYPLYPDNAPRPQRTLRDWMSAGPLEPRTLTHGNWPFSVTTRMSGFHVFSQYSYRNNPLFCYGGHESWSYGNMQGVNSPQVLSETAPLTIAFTKPKVVTDTNCPVFKTPRQARGRVLVADMFHAQGTPSPAPMAPIPGVGSQIHKDGYNLLSANYATAWYSDAEQRLIWWPNSTPCSYVMGTWNNISYSAGEMPMSGRPFNIYDWGRLPTLYQTPLVWHTMDKFVGVDVDIDPAAWVID